MNRNHATKHDSGKILVLAAILMPVLMGIAAIIFDGGKMVVDRRDMQHVADSAALAAGMEIRSEKSVEEVILAAREFAVDYAGYADNEVEVNVPPTEGAYSGSNNHVEVVIRRNYAPLIMVQLDGITSWPIEVRAVAGVEPVTEGAVMVALDPHPDTREVPVLGAMLNDIDAVETITDSLQQVNVVGTVGSIPIVGNLFTSLLVSLTTEDAPTELEGLIDYALATFPGFAAPAIIGGVEVEGFGVLIVDGAIHVNTEWGGKDENGDPAGMSAGPPYGVATMPLLATSFIQAEDIRVVGGVDHPERFSAMNPTDPFPLQANRLPVPDPFASLPTPAESIDEDNVSTTIANPTDLVRVALLPAFAEDIVDQALALIPAALRSLLDPVLEPVVELLSTDNIEPGVYHSITLIDLWGGIRLQPGIYILRGATNDVPRPLTILGPVQANGVMFYITNSPAFAAETGSPDVADDPAALPDTDIQDLLPSAVILPLLPNANISGLNDSGSPFDGFLLFQRRTDRRPIVMEICQNRVRGTIYAKWSNLLLLGCGGTNDMRLVAGTLRFVLREDTRLTPQTRLPPARDVLLLE
ncbi:Tad domain-containing protein [Blastopirellula marina]|uniref:Putative Flp pilus-assembly TadG-like N-terminal domain-containing protein n=1 Tax=Blastopirellula marina TaxID=124 RepID=A0A2S8G240_9BACT|nr:Tad domain-containing protein [Blastopirellula marina]PQO38515.1 hypothetical protein C5Y98_10715 [Blastopirellula marina]PTL45172.1 hypothetical protein C5Y97_10725 [Blastopirellula marina]